MAVGANLPGIGNCRNPFTSTVRRWKSCLLISYFTGKFSVWDKAGPSTKALAVNAAALVAGTAKLFDLIQFTGKLQNRIRTFWCIGAGSGCETVHKFPFFLSSHSLHPYCLWPINYSPCRVHCLSKCSALCWSARLGILGRWSILLEISSLNTGGLEFGLSPTSMINWDNARGL